MFLTNREPATVNEDPLLHGNERQFFDEATYDVVEQELFELRDQLPPHADHTTIDRYRYQSLTAMLLGMSKIENGQIIKDYEKATQMCESMGLNYYINEAERAERAWEYVDAYWATIHEVDTALATATTQIEQETIPLRQRLVQKIGATARNLATRVSQEVRTMFESAIPKKVRIRRIGIAAVALAGIGYAQTNVEAKTEIASFSSAAVSAINDLTASESNEIYSESVGIWHTMALFGSVDDSRSHMNLSEEAAPLRVEPENYHNTIVVKYATSDSTMNSVWALAKSALRDALQTDPSDAQVAALQQRTSSAVLEVGDAVVFHTNDIAAAIAIGDTLHAG